MAGINNKTDKGSDVKRTPGSVYSRTIYTVLWNIAMHMDFSKPIFMNKRKRSHSMASVQAYLVELALTDAYVMEKVRKNMFNGGNGYTHGIKYTDRYD